MSANIHSRIFLNVPIPQCPSISIYIPKYIEFLRMFLNEIEYAWMNESETIKDNQGQNWTIRIIQEYFANIHWHIWTFWDILQHSATFCHILPHSATFCNILGHSGIFQDIPGHTGTCNSKTVPSAMAEFSTTHSLLQQRQHQQRRNITKWCTVPRN